MLRPALKSSVLAGLRRRACWTCLNDLARTNACGTSTNALAGAVHDGVYVAQVHVPTPLGDVMGVADVVSELRTFAAHFTYACHIRFLGTVLLCTRTGRMPLGSKATSWFEEKAELSYEVQVYWIPAALGNHSTVRSSSATELLPVSASAISSSRFRIPTARATPSAPSTASA